MLGAKASSNRRPRINKAGLSNSFPKKRKPWNSTVQDLSAHKASKEEIEWRHRIHRSKNAERAKHELYDKATTGQRSLSKSHSTLSSPNKTGSARKIAALRQKLHGEKLFEVLAKSDKTLSLVKDLFGDDPKCYVGAPNVTVAPHIMKKKKALERTVMESSIRGPPPSATRSPAGIRDDSILELAPGKPALNELSSSSSSDSEEEALISTQQSSFRPTVDLKRFEKFITDEESKPETASFTTVANDTSTAGTAPHPLRNSRKAITKAQPKERLMESSMDNSLRTVTGLSTIGMDPVAGANEGDTVNSDLSNDMEGSVVEANLKFDKQAGIQDSDALKSVLNPGPQEHVVQQHLESGKSLSSNVSIQEMEILVQALVELDTELQKAETKPGRSPTRITPSKKDENPPTGNGLVNVLPRAVKRLLHYMNESERQLEAEMLLRGQLLQTMSDQQNLMDALTSDVISLREKNIGLRKELETTKVALSDRIAEVQKDVKLCFESYHKILMMLPVAAMPPSPIPPQSSHPQSGLFHIPAAVAQELSLSGSILAQPSPYRDQSTYPTSLVLSPAKNRQLYHKSETAAPVTAVPPLVMVTSNSSIPVVATDKSLDQSSSTFAKMSHFSMPPSPPSLDAALQPHPPSVTLSNDVPLSLPNNGTHSSTTRKEMQLPRVSKQNSENESGLVIDVGSELVEQHNVRVVPAVLSFASMSSFTGSVSQHDIPLSNTHLSNVVSTQAMRTSSLGPTGGYHSASSGHLGNSMSWSHPGGTLFAGTNSSLSQWSKPVQSSFKESPKDNGGWFSLSRHVNNKTTTS